MEHSRTAEAKVLRLTPEELHDWLRDVERDVHDGLEAHLTATLEERIAEIEEEWAAKSDVLKATSMKDDAIRHARDRVEFRRYELRTWWTLTVRDGESMRGDDLENLVPFDLTQLDDLAVFMRGLDDRKITIALRRKGLQRVNISGSDGEWVRRMYASALRTLKAHRPWNWWMKSSPVFVANIFVLSVWFFSLSLGAASSGSPLFGAWLVLSAALATTGLLAILGASLPAVKVAPRAKPRDRALAALRWIAATVAAGIIGALIALVIRPW